MSSTSYPVEIIKQKQNKHGFPDTRYAWLELLNHMVTNMHDYS